MAAAIDVLAPIAPARPSRTAGRVAAVAALTAGCLVAFLAVQAWLSARGYAMNVAQLRARGFTEPARHITAFGELRGVMADSGGVYLAMVIAAIAIGRRGPRVAMALPLAVWSVGPLLVGLLGGMHGPGSSAVVTPLPIGTEWMWLSASHHAFAWWFGSGVDAALVLVPAFAVSSLRTRVVTTSARRLRLLPSQIAAGSVAGFGLYLLVALPRIYGVPDSSFLSELVPLAALFAFGAALDERRPRRWPIVLAVPILATNSFTQWAVFRFPYPFGTFAHDVTPFVAAALLGASVRPMIRLFARLEARPVEALIACNALNVADALLTAIGVRGGVAVESNPVVKLIGLPVKVLLVALLSAALLRTRPRALIWPCAALACVVLWHVGGFVAPTPIAWWS